MLRHEEEHTSRGQQLSGRYNELRYQLERTASEDASAALFLPHVEACTQAVTNFVAVSHPLSTLAHIVAGQQLTQAKAWRDQAVKVAKVEWKSGKPPAQVLVSVMEQMGPEHKEVTGRVLEMMHEIEHWWARLQQESHTAPTPALAPAPVKRVPSFEMARTLRGSTACAVPNDAARVAGAPGKTGARVVTGARVAKMGRQTSFTAV